MPNAPRVHRCVLVASLALAAIFILGSSVHAAETHPAKAPAGVTLPAAADQTFAFFEGELKKDDRGDTLANEAHREGTIFCEKRSPNDQYWAEPVTYDGCRGATRGNAASHRDHRFEWPLTAARLRPGAYDAYVRANVAPGGSATYSLATSRGPIEALQGVKNETPNVSWFRLGSLMIEEGDAALTLGVETEKSPVSLDCVLLVSVDHVSTAAKLERAAGEEAWSSAASVIFAADRGQVLYDLKGGDATSEVTYTLRDETGREVTMNAKAARVEGAPNRWAIELPSRGYFDVAVRATSGRGEPAEARLTAAVIGPSLDESTQLASRFGVWNVHGDHKLAVLAGSRWNRRMTAFFDTKRDAVTEGPYVRAENATRAHEMDQVGVFAFGLPEWLMQLPEGHKRPSYGNPFYPAIDPQLLSNLVSSFLTTKPMPDVIEMYNEPDAHWHGKDEDLVQYAAAVRRGMKAVDPNFQLVGPCFYSIRMGDLKKLVDKGLLEHLDGLSMHGYVNGTPPEGEFVEKFAELKRFVAASSKPDMAIYVTEFGWTRAAGTWQEPVDTLTQAQYCARSLALGLAEDIDVLIYFALQYKTKNTGEAAFSLIDPEDRVSPAYVSYATVVKFFAAAEPIGRWSLTPTSHLVLAERDGQVLAAAWDTRGTRTVDLPWAVTQAISMTGTPMVIGEGNRIEIGPSPMYLTFGPGAPAAMPTAEPVELTIGDASGAPLKGALAQLGADAASGTYTTFEHRDGGWVAQPVTVHQPITLLETKLVWPADEAHPHLATTIRSNRPDAAVDVAARLEPAGRSSTLKLPARSIRVAKFPLADLVPGARSRFRVQVEADTGRGKVSLSDETEATLVLARQIADVSAAWPADAAMCDFTEWAPFPEAASAGADRDDCAARFRAVYGPEGLRFEIVVTDDEHRAAAAGDTPQDGWNRDSVQFAFDLDVDKPWTAGVVGAGLAGHRVFEFTVAQRPDDPAKAWVFRHRSFTESLPSNQLDETVRATVIRTGNETRYDILFPWPALAAAPMQHGETVGIAIAAGTACGCSRASWNRKTPSVSASSGCVSPSR